MSKERRRLARSPKVEQVEAFRLLSNIECAVHKRLHPLFGSAGCKHIQKGSKNI